MSLSASNDINHYDDHNHLQAQPPEEALSNQTSSHQSSDGTLDGLPSYLPKSTYVQPSRQQARTPSMTSRQGEASQNYNSHFGGSSAEPQEPHDFYRQYRHIHGDYTTGGLHQNSLHPEGSDISSESRIQRKLSPKLAQMHNDLKSDGPRVARSPQYTHVKTQPFQKASKSTSSLSTTNPGAVRKTSIKDLVARFDASPDDAPPFPSTAFARTKMKVAKSTPNKHSHIPTPVPPQQTSHSIMVSTTPQSSSNQQQDYFQSFDPARLDEPSANTTTKRPLFGEVVSGIPSHSGAGYGITNPRRRRGSEGSPMHTPNSMFSDTNVAARLASPLQQTIPNHNRQWLPSTGRLRHQRAQSDISQTNHISNFFADPRLPQTDPRPGPNFEANYQSEQTTPSKIPLKSREYSLTSDSSPSAPPPQISTALGKQIGNNTLGSFPHESNVNHKKRNQASPRRKAQTPPQIRSPGRSPRKIALKSENNSSLKANIIAPPPKVSPPLRSSRPRQPVSIASTVASRARVLNTVQAFNRSQADKTNNAPKATPKELVDSDIKARMLKVKQALDKSRESQELPLNQPLYNRRRPSAVSTTSSSLNQDIPESSQYSHAGSVDQPADVPAVIVEPSSGSEDCFETPQDQPNDPFAHQSSTYPSSPLTKPGSSNYSFEEDSPTLGQSHLPVHQFGSGGSQSTFNAESAHPVESLAPINSSVTLPRQDLLAQPQYDLAAQTPLFNHISNFREQEESPRLQWLSSENQSLDRADDESINIDLRSTTYMDEEEAIAKGYRAFAPPPTLPNLYERRVNERDSWTSSLAESSEAHGDLEGPGLSSEEQLMNHMAGDESHDDEQLNIPTQLQQAPISTISARDTAASDAYTIINIVLQQHSTSGIVDQGIVDDIYHSIIAEDPELALADSIDTRQVENMCLQKLSSYDSKVIATPTGANMLNNHETSNNMAPVLAERADSETIQRDEGGYVASTFEHKTVPQPSFRSHKYKSSLDSAQDWAETSPSIGDWMQFALDRDSDADVAKEPSPLTQMTLQKDAEISAGSRRSEEHESSRFSVQSSVLLQQSGSELGSSPSTPPPRPISKASSFERKPLPLPFSASETSLRQFVTPTRGASISRISSQGSFRGSFKRAQSGLEEPTALPLMTEQIEVEEKKIKQRRHVLKELVDTEYIYERDLRVLCDIYKQTANSTLVDEDAKLLFGNIDEVQSFAKDFLTYLKAVVRPAYAMDRTSRKDSTRIPASLGPEGSVKGSIRSASSTDLTDIEKDMKTHVGQAFEGSIADMEKVYTEYIRTRHAANKKFEQLQGMPGVNEWLQECHTNSSDITNAWNLDALLVKPIQRITKYPLLLKQLLDSTPADHPDREHLRRALHEVTEVNVRINDVKRHTELVDSVLSNRKRKESDVRNGLTKAFGRRAEKLRQHVGINELYEDHEFSRIKMAFDTNIVHLMIVTKDCQGYLEFIRRWVTSMCGMAAASEAWLDIKHTRHAEAASKIRQLAMASRGLSTIAVPDHTDKITRRILQPLEATVQAMEHFKSDPKQLLQKREKKIFDYSQARNKRERGEDLNRKLTDRLEQWEAINTEAKSRMRKLLSASANIVQTLLKLFINIHMDWLNMCNQKFSSAYGIPLEKIGNTDQIIREWQMEFDYFEASALSLSICNGSLLAEAVNMFSFNAPASMMNGSDSPRQGSWGTTANRSISINSESSYVVPGDHSSRMSGEEGPSFGRGRLRAISTASGRGSRNIGLTPQITNSASFTRPTTGRSDTGSSHAPRLSIDTPSPTIGHFRLDSPPRPTSSSTFFSAAPAMANGNQESGRMGSSIFSSAMPMSDSPENDSSPGIVNGQEPAVLFTAASVYEFNIDRSRHEGGIPYLTYVVGEIFDVIGERGELWLARNQDDVGRRVGWIWNKHFAKLAE